MDNDLTRRLEAATADAVAALRLIAAPRDWLDQILDGADALKSDEAAFVAGTHADTMRRRAESAALAGKPIGVLMAGAMWLFSERRLLDAIEERDGRPARLAAESRAMKSRRLRELPENSIEIPIATVV